MKTIKLRQWNSAEHLKTEEDIALYLEACLEADDSPLTRHAPKVIASARQAEYSRNTQSQADEG